MLSIAHGLLGDFEPSLRHATAGIDLDPDDDLLASLHHNRAASYLELGMSEDAIEDATVVIELDPSSGALGYALRIRGQAYEQLGRDELAAEDLRLGNALWDVVADR